MVIDRVASDDARTRRRVARLLAGIALVGASIALSTGAQAQCAGTTCTVASEADLRTAIAYANANANTTINLTSTVTLTTGDLPALQGTGTTVNGNGNTLNGGNTFRGLLVYSGTTRVENLAIADAVAQGGNSGRGGGGAGLGGALFVSSGATVTVSNVTLQGNQAVGGSGATGGTGGAGGMGGVGGSFGTSGGGGLGSGANGGAAGAANPGGSGIVAGAAAGGSSTGGGGANGGGGGGGAAGAGGGGGGVGGANASGTLGGNGGFGGGGGGASVNVAGAGGFGGGGGGSGGNRGGAGGFGGGGGGGLIGAAGGFGGGGGRSVGAGGGGGGAGMGGAIFVVEGGNLVFEGALAVAGGGVAGGAGNNGGGNGSAFGSGLFLQGNGTITFQPGAGSTQTMTDVIADQTGSGGTGINNFASGGPTCTVGVGCGSYSGAGSWGLTKDGAGMLVLAAANTYTGGTVLNGGTLGLAHNQALGTGPLTILGSSTVAYANGVSIANLIDLQINATLNVDTGTATHAGAIGQTGGSFGITKTGAGTLVVSGANTYAGGTVVQAGTLQLSGAGTLGATTGATTVAGGTLDLGSTTQTQNGGVTLTAGIIQNGTLSSSGLFDMQAGTVSAVLAGTGVLTKSTIGTVTLSGINTYTGATTVNAGTLAIAPGGSIVSAATVNSGGSFIANGTSAAVTVNAGGLLGGNGIVGNTTINGGTLSPGNSIGTLTVQGNLVMSAAAAYLVEVSGNAADRTNVTGTATLGGTVQVLVGAGGIARSYTILHADGGFGGSTFGGVSANTLNLAASLSYTATDVILNFAANLGGGAALSGNQQGVAGAINGFFNNGGTLPAGFSALFGLTGASLANALTLLSGEVATGAQQGAFQLNNQFLGLMLDPFVDGRAGVAGAGGQAIGFAPEREEMPDEIALAYAKVTKTPVYKAPVYAPTFEQRWSVWGGGFGGTNKTSGDPLVAGSHDLTARTAGFAAGMDYRLAPGTVVGFALAGGGTNWGLANGLGTGKSDAFQAGLYGSTRWGALYVAAALAYAWHDVSTDRFAFAGNHLTAEFDAQSVGGRIEAGYRAGSSIAAIIPYAAVQAQNFRTPSYVESDLNAGGFGLAYNSRNGTATRSELGARADRLFALNPAAVLALRGRLAWAHDWVSDPTLAAGFQTLPGASFIVNGATPAKDLALVSAGAELRLANGVTLSGKFDGELAEHSNLRFFSTSTAGNATIITNNGGDTRITASASGGQASFITNAGGQVAISQLTGAGTTAGSIEGAGNYFLGSKNLTVGGNDLSTTVSGIISDGGLGGGVGGSLTKVGNGTLTLAGANTYTGGTIVGGGTLRVSGSIANTASIAVDPGGVLQADHAGALGSVRVDLSGGTLRTNFTGTFANEVVFTTIGLSALTAAAGTQVTLTGPIALDNNAVAQFGSPADTGTVIIAPGVVASGAAAAIVAGGKLIVNGTLEPFMGTTVNAGATLGGTGTVGAIGATTTVDGTLAPGNSIGTLTVQGNLVMTAASSYIVEVSPTNADRTNVTGTATLGGTVQAVFLPGSYVTRSYTILHADGGLGGSTFNGLTITPPGFTASLSYTTTDVLLNLTANLGMSDLRLGGLNQNQANVAGAINGFFNAGGTLPPNFLPLFGLTGVNLANALTPLSGEVATGAQQGAFQLNTQFLGMMLDPFVDGRAGVAGASGQAIGFAPEREEMPDEIALAYAKVTKTPVYKAPVYAQTFEQRWSVWGGGFGGTNKTSGDPLVVGSHDLTARTAGFAAGMDYRVAPGTVVGFALAGGGTNWGLANGLGTGKSDAFQAGLYGSTRWGALYVAAALAYAWHDVSTDRFAFAGNHLTASFDAQSVAGRIEAGYRAGSSIAAIIPYAAVQAQNFRTPSYVEADLNAGGFGLAYNSRNGTATRSELGARADRLFALNPTAVLALRGRLAWAHDWVSDPSLAAGFQTLPGASFIVNGATPAKDLALVSAGAELRLANGVTLSGKLDGELAEHSTT